MAVEREPRVGLFRHVARTVMRRGEFEVQFGAVEVRRVVLNPHVWDGNLDGYNPEAMPGSDFSLPVRVFLALAECRQIAVEDLLQFVIERNSEVLSALAHDF